MTRDLTIRRVFTGVAFVCCLMPLLACFPAHAREPRQVMLLFSFGKDFKPWSAYATAIRAELTRQSPWPLDITEQSLVTARSGDENPEPPFVEYLRSIFARRPLDLVVALGAPAAAFVQRHREQLFKGTPMVFMAVDQRRVQYSTLTPNDAVVAVRINYLAAVENILKVLPETKDVMVVVGTSPIEKFWKEAIGKELEPLAGRINVSWTDQLSFDDLLKRAAVLPRNSAIFWELMIVDAVGVVHEGGTALSQLHAVANAPIFSYDESFFGREIVGGPLLLVEDSSRQAAAVAIRILKGEKPNEINSPLVQFASPMFDWREMQRWGIGESRLPPGSRIFFRNPTLWSQYRWQLILIVAAILSQALLIVGLLYEHRRRRLAEVVSFRRMAELAHLNRVATAGELSASIAHEVRQPLAAMVAQSSAAQRWLAQKSPNLDEAQTALKKIVLAGERASQIIENLRSIFRKESGARKPLDINAMVQNVLALTSRDAHRHGIIVQTSFADTPKPQVLGDLAQLEQVFLNLVMNAVEAMGTLKDTPRVLELTTAVGEAAEVLITVADTGPGVEEGGLEKMFDAFFTTKPQGMGMGLSICRSIVESHGGRLWASRRDRGLVFYVVLPGAEA